MINLKERSPEKELMDDLSISFEEFQQTLGQIEVINHLSFAYTPVLSLISDITKRNKSNQAISILDIGFGNGDYLRKIYKWGKKKGIDLNLLGVDLNPCSAQAAELLSSGTNIKYISSDIFDFKPEQQVDICINSLCTHHMSNEEVIRLISWMTENTRHAWMINDLHRHPLAYYFIKYFTEFLPFNRLVKNDACLSVARAFKKEELETLISDAGIDFSKMKISWQPNFRYYVQYKH